MGYARPFDLDVSMPIERAEPASAGGDKLLGLELLRFASALAVLVFHYSHFAHIDVKSVNTGPTPCCALLWPFYDYGLYGVQLFWWIIGYIFFWKYGAAIRSRAVAARDFFWLRFSRLYPLHLATLGGVVGLQ